jgi:hypothetical protein
MPPTEKNDILSSKRDATNVVGIQPKVSLKDVAKKPIKDPSKPKAEDTELIKLIKENQIKPRGPKQPYELASGAVTPTASPIDAAVLAASGMPQLIGRGLLQALPYLDAPLTVGSKVFPSVTANNVLNAAGAAYSGEQIINPESDLRTNPNAENILMTGLGLVGLPYKSAGLSFIDDLGQAGKYLTEETALKNAYKLNPWAFKANSEAFYHRSPNLKNIINQEKGTLQGFGNSEEGKAYSDLARPGQGPEKIRWDGTISRLNLRKPANSQLYFSKGVPLDYGRYNPETFNEVGKRIMTGQGYQGPYLVEVEGVPMGASVKGRLPSADPVSLESYAVSKRPINLDEAKFYKEDWLKGYKPIKVPKTITANSAVDDVGSIYSKNPLSDKDKELYEWFDEEMRFNKLPQTTNKQSIEVLDSFKQRIRTPEGQKRLKELGITEEQLLQDLKIVEDPNTYGYYRSGKNTIAMNPIHPLPKKVVRHEIEHAVQNALRQSKINKVIDGTPSEKLKALESSTTEIDDILSGLTLRREGTLNKVWNKNDTKKIVNIDDYKSLINNKQNATDYFLTGSDGAEKSAFLGEVQQYMMDTGKIPKNSYVQITPEMVKETMVDAMFDEAGGGKYLRLFNIMKADPKNYELISKGLNKMLSVTPYIGLGGAGALGAEGLQENNQEHKYGGNMKLNKYNYGGYMNKRLYANGGTASVLNQSNITTGEVEAEENTLLDKNKKTVDTKPTVSNNKADKTMKTANVSSPVNLNIPSFQSKPTSSTTSNYNVPNSIIGGTGALQKSLDTFSPPTSNIQAPTSSDILPTMDMSTAPTPTTSLNQLGQGPELNANTSLSSTAQGTPSVPKGSGISAGQVVGAVQGGINTYNAINAAAKLNQGNTTGIPKSQQIDANINAVDTTINSALNMMGPVGQAVSAVRGVGDMIGKPIKEKAEARNPDGTLQDPERAKTSAIIGSFFDPIKAITTRASYEGGWTDFTGDKYIQAIEGKKKINYTDPDVVNRNLKVAPESNMAKYGGKIYSWGGNIYANGGNTIYVNNPNDPRLQAYNDSLQLSKQVNKLKDNYPPYSYEHKEVQDIIINNRLYGSDLFDNPKNRKAAQGISKTKNEYDIKPIWKKLPYNKEDGNVYEQTFKKPVQPVIYQKPKLKMVNPTLEVDVKPRMVQGTMEQDVRPKYWESEYSASYGNPNIGKGRINYGNGKVQEYAMGGPINTMYAGGGSMYNMPTKGLTHEQHPWGGYPIGGNNYVEGGEVILDKPDGGKYIFSNRLIYK